MGIGELLSSLEQTKPGSPRANELRRAAERSLMRMLRAGGVRTIERLVKDLNAAGRCLQPKPMWAGVRCWREERAGGERAIELSVGVNRVYRFAHLRHLSVPKLTPRQRKAQALQKLFYDRYREVGQRAYRDKGYRPCAMDRRLLLVGELEADVNNGGFSQYLGNKGRRRARAALAALEAIGARKTAKMLSRALAPRASDAELSRLAARFCKAPEDLAALAARHAGL